MDKDVMAAKDELRKMALTRGKRKMAIRPKTPDGPFMKIEQVLEVVPVGRSTLYYMIDRGQFPAGKKLGSRAVAWSRAEVDEWIREKLAQ